MIIEDEFIDFECNEVESKVENILKRCTGCDVHILNSRGVIFIEDDTRFSLDALQSAVNTIGVKLTDFAFKMQNGISGVCFTIAETKSFEK